MVRRSTIDRSPQSAVHGADYAAVTDDLPSAGRARGGAGRPWRGAGGRWLVWLFRAVAWAVLVLVGYRGVLAIVASETGRSRPAAAPAARPAGFPSQLAGAYALSFAQVYLNASPATAGQRASELAAFLPPGAVPGFGWNGAGSLRLESEQLAGVRVRDPHHAVVLLLARVNGRLMELGVPLYSARGGLVVSGEPAWLPAPRRAVLPSAPPSATDSATQRTLMSQLPAFFQAYAHGDQATLRRFLAPGTSITGLNGQVAFNAIASLNVPPGGATRHVTATVLWRVPAPAVTPSAPPAGLAMSYALTIVRLNGTWYVRSISPSAQSLGQP